MTSQNIPRLLERIEQLEAENEALKARNAALAEEKCDLEMLMEMSSDHADEVGHELLDKANAFKEMSDVILETAPIPILVTQFHSGKILYLNEQSAALFGMNKESLVGKKVLDLFCRNEDDLFMVIDIQFKI